MTEWFERWFGEEYLRLYQHRDDEEAERVVALIARHVPLEGRRVLDLACGSGRHICPLVRRGTLPIGLDLSLDLLRRARRQPGADTALVRGDMRALPFRDRAFGVVVNLFTSFGYFADDHQHQRVLAEAGRVLDRGGHFVLDFLNAPHVTATLVPREESKLEGHRALIRRRVTESERFVVKEITLPDDGRRFEERVRLFDAAELEAMITRAGLEVLQRFGDYLGERHSDTAPRVIFIAVRP